MFQEFPKMARLTRDCVITEKIDGTNAQVHIVSPSVAADISTGLDDSFVIAESPSGHVMLAGSRTKYLRVGRDGVKGEDNFGFAAWVHAHADELFTLGEGRHYGEWWGQGIQRGYGLTEKRFSLFNTGRWVDSHVAPNVPSEQISEQAVFAPECCHVVPVLYRGLFGPKHADNFLDKLRAEGSMAAPGFMNPEGVVVFHTAASVMFKKTIDKDEEGKEQKARRLAHA